jgi:hypothetical protein
MSEPCRFRGGPVAEAGARFCRGGCEAQFAVREARRRSYGGERQRRVLAEWKRLAEEARRNT